ncbi:hypothetical protein NDU88_007579 [Pleurodeles waltl]|uniref:Uncharacterized protein n=1 Tax=Pleurodeles waltl TaxID=8319 RepID=A0AAV7ST58_PLEWA|nr:hypothetical protein NDU88_007579 [Pleurodeles waltl]
MTLFACSTEGRVWDCRVHNACMDGECLSAAPTLNLASVLKEAPEEKVASPTLGHTLWPRARRLNPAKQSMQAAKWKDQSREAPAVAGRVEGPVWGSFAIVRRVEGPVLGSTHCRQLSGRASLGKHPM